jgi:3-methyladenine DNA glycosylase AlkD
VTANADQVRDILARLERRGSRRNVEGMARYGIVAAKVFGVSVGELRTMARGIGRDHDLAAALWASGWHETRMLAALVEEPERVARAQMDRWAADFDNWAICDTVCFHLFDRVPNAWRVIAPWSRRRDEFVKRAAFALLASIALHDRGAPDAPFVKMLPLIARGADDDRNFVKKGVSWALRGIGARSPGLHAKSLALAGRLAGSKDAATRWVGKDALRDLSRPMVRRRAEKRAAASLRKPRPLSE